MCKAFQADLEKYSSPRITFGHYALLMRSITFRKFSFLLSLYISIGMLQAQIEHSAFTTTGRGAATPFVTDYHAIGSILPI